MINVVKKCIAYKEQKRDTVLVGIVEASGSLPRKRGAYMLVDENGSVAGTVGGGALEYQAITFARGLFQEKAAGELKAPVSHHYLEYELTLGDSAALGMVCGGRAKLLLYPIPWREARLDSWLSDWEAALEQGESHLLRFFDYFTKTAPELIFEETIRGDGVVYLLGAGHLARELVPLLAHMDFYCVVADNRAEFAKKEYFPGAKEVLIVDFLHLEHSIQPKAGDYIAIMTSGHEFDYYGEVFALKTQAAYIGVVGSRKKTAYVNQRLREAGFQEQDIARIVTPIGLNIGSETPAEIAISIAAQLVQVRAEKRGKDEAN